MFNLIEPQEYHLYESSIHPFLQGLRDSMVLTIDQDLTQATFLLVRQEIEGIKGGSLLLKQNTRLLPSGIAQYLQSVCPQLKEIWTGMIAFQMCEEVTRQDFDKICKILYRALYEDLIVFGIKENTPFLCLTMSFIEHLTIDMLGLWPYVLEVKSHVPDGLFHGILALSWIHQAAHPFWKNDQPLKFLDSDCVFQVSPHQRCNKIDTSQKKMKSFFPL